MNLNPKPKTTPFRFLLRRSPFSYGFLRTTKPSTLVHLVFYAQINPQPCCIVAFTAQVNPQPWRIVVFTAPVNPQPCRSVVFTAPVNPQPWRIVVFTAPLNLQPCRNVRSLVQYRFWGCHPGVPPIRASKIEFLNTQVNRKPWLKFISSISWKLVCRVLELCLWMF